MNTNNTNNTEIELVSTYGGNNQLFTRQLPLICLLVDHDMDKVTFEHIKKNTGLEFKSNNMGGYEAQPITSNQIVQLLLTYNMRTQYYNNSTFKNTLFIKYHFPERSSLREF